MEQLITIIVFALGLFVYVVIMKYSMQFFRSIDNKRQDKLAKKAETQRWLARSERCNGDCDWG